ncbi:MAG: SurA N-terminal domain-containing protein [Orrella sp.]
MFDFIRTHRRLAMLALLVLVVPAFAFFGIEGYTGFMSNDKELAKVNGVAITEPEFDQARRAQLEQMRSMQGSDFDAEALDTPAFRQRILDELINRRVIATAAMDGRYTVSDEALRDAIAEIPAVQEDGKFSAQRYRQILAGQGMTPADFEMGLRRDLILAQVLGPIGQTARTPTAVINQIVDGLTEQRTVAVRRFARSAYEADVSITEEDIQAWYDANADRIRQPASVDVQYIVLDEQAASSDVTVPESEVQTYYEQNESRFGQPERRRVRHILFEVPADADAQAKEAALAEARAILEQLKADPTQFAELAAENSDDPGSASQGGDLGWISKDTLVPEVEAAVFDLPENQISDAVESPFGYHVLEVTEIQEPTVKPLAQVRDEVIAEITRQMAAARFADIATQMTSLVYEQRDALAPVAEAVGLPLQTAKGLSREGLIADTFIVREEPLTEATEEILNQPRVRQVAFSSDVLTDRFNSGAIEIAPDLIVALRVTELRPEFVPPLEQVSDLIREELVEERALALAREAGKAALLVANETEEPEGFEPAQVVSRQDPRELTSAEIQAVTRLPKADVPTVVGVDTQTGFSLLNVVAVNAGEALPEGAVDQLEQQLSEAWGGAEERAALEILRQRYEVTMLPDAQALIKADNNR